MSHSRYNLNYGPKHNSSRTSRYGMTAAVAQALTATPAFNAPHAPVTAAPQPVTGSRAQVSADPHRQDAPVAIRAFAAVSKWWYFPAIVTASAVFIMLSFYMVSFSQFGTNMVFMFKNHM